MHIIEDGKGTGQKAEVTEDNQVSVRSESIPSEGYQAQSGKAIIIHGECHTSASSSGGFMQITNNDTNFDLEVTRIYIDPHVLTPADLIVTQVFDATGSGGSDGSIIQKNRNTAETFDLTVKISDASSNKAAAAGTSLTTSAHMPTN